MYDRAKLEAMLEDLSKLKGEAAKQYLQKKAKEDPETIRQLYERLEKKAKPHYLSDTEYEMLEAWVLEEAEEGKPHIAHNEPLIAEFFRDFGEEYPEATLYLCESGDTQYICMNDTARKTLCEMIENGKAELDAEPEEVDGLFEAVWADIKA